MKFFIKFIILLFAYTLISCSSKEENNMKEYVALREWAEEEFFGGYRTTHIETSKFYISALIGSRTSGLHQDQLYIFRFLEDEDKELIYYLDNSSNKKKLLQFQIEVNDDAINKNIKISVNGDLYKLLTYENLLNLKKIK
ncbi:MAG: hypothetical protein NE330_14210 [Lentisphaeraceae bacterium]|nr:hypothetical protein [Lentisphaeraceae bacterium]